MKRILTLILVLVLALGMFASCDKIQGLIPGLQPEHEHSFAEGKCECGAEDPNYVPHTHNYVEGKCECGADDPDYVPTPEVDEDLASAKEFLDLQYKSLKKTPEDYQLCNSLSIGTTSFSVVWTSSSDKVVISAKEDGSCWVVTVPEAGAEPLEYTITYTVSNEAGETLNGSFNLVVPAAGVNTFAEYVAAENGDKLTVRGVVTAIMSKSTGSDANGLFLQDLNNEGGYYIFGLEADPHGVISIGMTVEVKGTKGKNYDNHQIQDATAEIVNAEINPVTPVDYTDILLNAKDLKATELVEKQGLLVTIKGATVLEVDGKYYYFQLGNNKPYVYISTTNNPTSDEALEAIKTAHANNKYNKADVTGVVVLYNGAFYLLPVSENAFSNFVTVDQTDSFKVAESIKATTVKTVIQTAGSVTLPTKGTSFAEVSISWELIAGDSTCATLNGNVVTYTIPESAQTLTLKATFTLNNEVQTKEYTVTVKPISTITIKEAQEIAFNMGKDQYTEEVYYIEGKITQISNPTYGNMYIEVVIDGGTYGIEIYGSYDKNGNKYGDMSVKPLVGDTIKVLTVVGKYNEPQLKNATIVEHTIAEENQKPEGGDDTPSTKFDIVTAPQVGVAYKFGFFQAGLNLQLYFNGSISSSSTPWYFATTESTADAVDVYLEAVDGVEGGYRLYFYAGDVKTYVVAYPRDNDTTKGTLKLDTVVPDTYFTFNTEYNTLVYTSTTGEQFYMGTNGTYKTVSCSAISYITSSTSYISHLYAEDVNGGDNGGSEGGNQGGSTPETPTDSSFVTNPQVGVAYKFGMYQTTKDAVYFITGNMASTYYLESTTDASASLDVYLEQVDGGYNLYTTISGAKKYINMKANGTHVNAVYEDAAATTYTIKEDGVIVSTVNDTEYAFGNYGSYTNIGTTQTSKDSYFVKLYTIASDGGNEGGNQGGETPDDGGEDTHEHKYVDGKCECGETDPNYQPPAGDDDGVMSIPEVLASASGTSVVVKGTVSEIYQSWNDQYSNISFYIKDDAGNKLLAYRCKGTKVVVGDVVTITGTTTVYSGTIQIAEGCTAVIDIKHVCSEFTTGSCTTDSYCVVCGQVSVAATGHNYVDGACDKCGAAEPQGDVLPGNLVFTSAANKADGDSYFKSNFPEWKITGKLGQTYGGYLGFGRSGDSKSSITSSTISVSSAFTVTTVLKGNGSSGVATSTLTFTLIDKDGNTIATGYADGSTTAAITPVDAKDTTYNISFTFVDGKTWTDVSNLVVSFSKATGNIGLKSLNFVQ